MEFPFSVEDFLNVFKSYNQAVFPIQILFYIIAAVSVYLLFKPTDKSGKLISAVLAFFWFWIGIVYHIIFFTSINKAAYFFGALFIIQGIIFLFYGLYKNNLLFEYRKDISNIIGIIFIAYALIIYPILGYLFGHEYPSSPTFGLPCPTTIFTFGLLLFTRKKISILVLMIPLLWSIIGFGAALKLSIYEDYGLLFAGIVGFTLLILKNKEIIK
jgi:hypothetical protein